MRMARATTDTFMSVEKWWLELEQARAAWKPLCCLMLRPSAAPQFMGREVCAGACVDMPEFPPETTCGAVS